MSFFKSIRNHFRRLGRQIRAALVFMGIGSTLTFNEEHNEEENDAPNRELQDIGADERNEADYNQS